MTTPLIEAIASSITDAKVAFRRTNDARLAKHGLWPNPAAEPPVNDLAQAALTAITEAGYVCAPKEPTDAMERAAIEEMKALGGVVYGEDAFVCYRAMISAAQGGDPTP